MTNEASCSCCLSSSPTKSIMKLAWISRLSSFSCFFLWAALSLSVSEAVDRHDVNPSLKGRRCGRSGDGKMSYTWGDALSLEASGESDVDCIGPDGQRYPTELVDKLARSMSWAKSANSVGNHRQGRSQSMEVQDPLKTRDMLLRFHHQQPSDFMPHDRKKRATHVVIRDDPSQGKLGNDVEQTADTYQKQEQQQSQCGSSTAGHPPARLCQSRYNTTAPMFGVSLTSGRTVTIVQKFPDLLQQVVFEVCESKECDVLRGECVQTYVPYLFLVIPLGPVTLTGQDYVLVESGCVCRPKYGVHVPQTLDSYFQPPLPTKAPANSSADIDDESLP